MGSGIERQCGWETGEPLPPSPAGSRGLCGGEGLLTGVGHKGGGVKARGEAAGAMWVPLGSAGEPYSLPRTIRRVGRNLLPGLEVKHMLPCPPHPLPLLFQISACSCWT